MTLLYSRSYYPKDNAPGSLPENYDGTAFSDQEAVKPELPYEAPDFIPESNEEPAESVSSVPVGAGDSVRGFNLPFLSGLGKLSLGGLFGGEGSIFSDFGMEEILILAVAAYLIFSGSGDIECAVMLLLLLFIS